MEKVQTGKALSSVELRELSKYEGGPFAPGEVETIDQVAAVFGVTGRTVHYWQRDGMPVNPNGRYDVNKIQAWRLSKGQKNKAEILLNIEQVICGHSNFAYIIVVKQIVLIQHLLRTVFVVVHTVHK